MKKFIKTLVTFTLVPTVVSILLVSITWFFYQNKINGLRVNDATTVLISGDSHTESGVNDSLLKNSLNISKSSESYIYTYNVLNVIVKHNHQIKTIILGCSFHNFSDGDKYIFDYEKSLDQYPVYFPVLDKESIGKLASNNTLGVLKSSIKIWLKMVVSIAKTSKSFSDYPFIGKYYKSSKSNLNDSTVMKAIKRHYYQDNGGINNFSNLQLYYLNKIVALCKIKNIRLVLINTPVSNMYFEKIPPKSIERYYSVISNLKPEIDFWDLHSLKLASICFGDGDHLNSIGATLLTQKIDSLMTMNKAKP